MSTERPSWLRSADTDPERVAEVYDDWADAYDEDVASWEYEAPRLVARTLATADPTAAPILDVGCGTGLVGRELHALGRGPIVGIDLSARSVEVATRSGWYDDVHRADVQTAAIPFDADTFGALVCVGVMTYLPDTDRTVREFCRVVRPGGSIVFTQRRDMWVERGDDTTLRRLAAAGICEIVAVDGPVPYLPGNDALGDVPAMIAHLRVDGRGRRATTTTTVR
jgi:predicted TPR repeat methyltransferase